MDVDEDVFAKEPYGQIALTKFKQVSENFRLYCAEWLETGGPPETWEVMAVTGAEFRAATRGQNRGKLTVMVPNTKRTVHVHVSEMKTHNAQAAQVAHQ